MNYIRHPVGYSIFCTKVIYRNILPESL